MCAYEKLTLPIIDKFPLYYITISTEVLAPISKLIATMVDIQKKNA